MNPIIKTSLAIAILFAISCRKEFEHTQSTRLAGETTPSDVVTGKYPVVLIGTQKWMATNLSVSHYRNGDKIPQVKDSAQWAKLTTGAWCWYNNDSATGAVYGKLYNWFAIHDPRGLAPAGWHVPSDSEWYVVSNFLGANAHNAGGK